MTTCRPMVALFISAATLTVGCSKIEKINEIDPIADQVERNSRIIESLQQELKLAKEKASKLIELEELKLKRKRRERYLEEVASLLGKARAIKAASIDLVRQMEFNKQQKEAARNQRNMDSSVEAIRGNAAIAKPIGRPTVKSIYFQELVKQKSLASKELRGSEFTEGLDSQFEQDAEDQAKVVEKWSQIIKQEFGEAEIEFGKIIKGAFLFGDYKYIDWRLIPVASEFLDEFDLKVWTRQTYKIDENGNSVRDARGTPIVLELRGFDEIFLLNLEYSLRQAADGPGYNLELSANKILRN